MIYGLIQENGQLKQDLTRTKELYDNAIKRHQEYVQGTTKNANWFAEEIEKLEKQLTITREALIEAHSMISATGYTKKLENGSVVLNGNEWPWIQRGIKVMKEAIDKLAEHTQSNTPNGGEEK